MRMKSMENAIEAKEGLLTVNSFVYFDYSHQRREIIR